MCAGVCGSFPLLSEEESRLSCSRSLEEERGEVETRYPGEWESKQIRPDLMNGCSIQASLEDLLLVS